VSIPLVNFGSLLLVAFLGWPDLVGNLFGVLVQQVVRICLGRRELAISINSHPLDLILFFLLKMHTLFVSREQLKRNLKGQNRWEQEVLLSSFVEVGSGTCYWLFSCLWK